MPPPIMPMSALLSALRGAGRQHLTASTVAARQAITGSHVLRIQDYTKVLRKRVPTGEFFESAPFRVAGHDWRIACYPNGTDREHAGYTSLFLKSLSPHDGPFAFHGTTARVEATVLDDRAGKPWLTRATEHRRFLGYEAWGWKDFVKNDDLDNLPDDCLTVLCDVTVDDLPLHAEEVTAEVPEPMTDAAPPLSDLGAEATWTGRPRDVMMIHVGGERFAAHRRVLEAGSPVFKAELQNATSGELHIADMDAEVFKALLDFMYTETLRLEEPTMAERLLVAADRYGLEKLKLACGEALCGRVDMGSVAAMLALAERHGCAVLKEACVEFLSCPDNLRLFMETDGYEQLKKDCPLTAVDILVHAIGRQQCTSSDQ